MSFLHYFLAQRKEHPFTVPKPGHVFPFPRVPFSFKDRKPVWIALSDLYLDTELDDKDLDRMAKALNNSPYTWQEMQWINKYEVYPVLASNLVIDVAGAWAGFQEEWLIKKYRELAGKA